MGATQRAATWRSWWSECCSMCTASTAPSRSVSARRDSLCRARCREFRPSACAHALPHALPRSLHMTQRPLRAARRRLQGLARQLGLPLDYVQHSFDRRVAQVNARMREGLPVEFDIEAGAQSSVRGGGCPIAALPTQTGHPDAGVNGPRGLLVAQRV